ncbi:MAG: hypothetical protein EBX62_02280 [Betaproteobacteria bacterium]|nr:hypothetical protein [Betaproteobacteria bacterium]
MRFYGEPSGEHERLRRQGLKPRAGALLCELIGDPHQEPAIALALFFKAAKGIDQPARMLGCVRLILQIDKAARKLGCVTKGEVQTLTSNWVKTLCGVANPDRCFALCRIDAQNLRPCSAFEPDVLHVVVKAKHLDALRKRPVQLANQAVFPMLGRSVLPQCCKAAGGDAVFGAPHQLHRLRLNIGQQGQRTVWQKSLQSPARR